MVQVKNYEKEPYLQLHMNDTESEVRCLRIFLYSKHAYESEIRMYVVIFRRVGIVRIWL